MGEKDRTYTFSDLFHYVTGTHGTAADTSPAVVNSGGKHTTAPTAIVDGNAVVLWLSKHGYILPERQVILLDSQTTASGSGTGTALTGLGVYKDADVHVDVTLGTGTSGTLLLYLDARLDGTAWTNLARLTAFTTAAKSNVHLSKRQGAAEIAAVGTDAGAGTVRAMGWADDLRIRRDITGTSPSFSYRVWVNLV